MKDEVIELIAYIITAVLIICGIVGVLYAFPQYIVYSKRMSGVAELQRAESNKKIMIEDAKARKESAEALAEAEIIRAKGVAEANKIIGDSLKQNEGYLRYLYINSLSEAESRGNKVIYIPTEAGLPILEAGMR